MSNLTEYREWRDSAFEDPDQKLIFRFRIEFEALGGDRKKVRRVEPMAFLAKRPNEVYKAHDLSFGHKTQVYHVFSNGDILEGWLEWQDRLIAVESQQVIARISLQSAATREVWHYEGFIVQFGSREPAPPPPPPDPPFPPTPDPFPDDSAAITVAQTNLASQELFPFIYMQPWPDLPEEVQAAEFISVTPGITDNNLFWTTLAPLKTSGDAPGMRTQAVDFIDGDDTADVSAPYADVSAPYKGEFIETTAMLAPPFNSYLRIWDGLERDERPDFKALTKLVDKHFTSWTDYDDAVATTAAQTDLQRIWNSLVALMIIMGYRHRLLADFIRLLIVHHVLQSASVYAAKLPKPAKQKKARARESDAKIREDEDDKTSIPPPEPLVPTHKQIQAWHHATVVAPAAIFPLPGNDTTNSGDGTPDSDTSEPKTWVRPYAIGAARSVHCELQSYQLGEVQRIENILRGEVRERTNRNLKRSETTTESGDSTQSRDQRAEDQFSSDLINQVQKTLSDHVTATRIDNYTTSYGPSTKPNITASGNWWVQEQPAGGYLRDVSKFAKEVIEKTVRRISRQVNHRRSTISFEETEVRDISRFENLGGGDDICGVYRWINRSYRLTSRDLGDRLVVEIILDQPAAFLLQTLRTYWQLDLMTRPPSPAEAGIASYTDVCPDPPPQHTGETPAPAGQYYLDLFEIFGVDDSSQPPPALVTVRQGLQSRNPVAETHIDVPKGYVATAARAQVTSFNPNIDTEVYVGTTKLADNGDDDGLVLQATATLNKLAGVSAADGSTRLWVSVLCKAKSASNVQRAAAAEQPAPDTSLAEGSQEFTTYFLANIEIDCARSDQCLADWQYSAYRMILAGYNAQLAAYHTALAAQKEAIEAENPDFLRDLVGNQVLQGCLAQLYALFAQDTKLATPAKGVPDQMDIGEPRIFQYLRNALSWDEMNCQLFLNYADVEGRWMQEGQSAILSDLSPDLQFRNFLRADRARVLVTVRPDLARGLLYFLRSGQIWPDSDELAPCLDGDQATIAKIKAQFRNAEHHDRIEDFWTVQVPTSMTVLSSSPFHKTKGE